MWKFGIITIVLAACSIGCQSEAERQHHLFALEKCKAQTFKVDPISFPYYPAESGKLTRSEAQASHDYRAINCMAVEEKTTEDFQRQKHDDYGVVRDEDLRAALSARP
ncbi:MAG: hypothetical protein ABSD13_10365 [Candidatus Korobacteraceae bacterium]|jgi:hypothetical protein